MFKIKARGRTAWACAIATLVLAISADALAVAFTQTNLVSDLPGMAAQLDPNLVNPWGHRIGRDRTVLGIGQWHALSRSIAEGEMSLDSVWFEAGRV